MLVNKGMNHTVMKLLDKRRRIRAQIMNLIFKSNFNIMRFMAKPIPNVDETHLLI